MAAQVLYGLAGAAPAVLFRLSDPVQTRQVGDGLELLADQEPLGQVLGDRRRGGGNEAVFRVDGEVEMVGQKADPFCEGQRAGRDTATVTARGGG
ncbi:hypothetical protein [Streptomyces sp. NPDC005877]|uniref:hypothetical protein n=1 Tax=Streptomyces sp. NPDC005877 TaxID=3155346 RepID=UPI0033F95B7B